MIAMNCFCNRLGLFPVGKPEEKSIKCKTTVQAKTGGKAKTNEELFWQHWTYTPIRGKENTNACDETKWDAVQLPLGYPGSGGVLSGRTMEMLGLSHMPCGPPLMPPKALGTRVHIGAGFWVTLVVHISDQDAEASKCEVLTKLGNSKRQVAYETLFMPIFGVSFCVANFTRMVSKYGGHLVNLPCLSTKNKAGIWSDTHAWHSLFGLSPIDLKTLVSRGFMMSSSAELDIMSCLPR